jgi:3D (Asp-Asp-Asp) domain-containing protein
MYAGIGRLLIACAILLACVTPAADLPKVTITPIPSRGEVVRLMEFEVTAFDLSVQCCGKPLGHPARGITKGGYNLNGMTRAQAQTIACNSLPIGARVRLIFEGSRAQYSGVYVVRDTGGMGAGVLDLFMGDFGEEVGAETEAFGRVTAKAEIL